MILFGFENVSIGYDLLQLLLYCLVAGSRLFDHRPVNQDCKGDNRSGTLTG